MKTKIFLVYFLKKLTCENNFMATEHSCLFNDWKNNFRYRSRTFLFKGYVKLDGAIRLGLVKLA